MMDRKGEHNKNVARSDNSYQILIDIEDSCKEMRRKGYDQKLMDLTIKRMQHVKHLEEK